MATNDHNLLNNFIKCNLKEQSISKAKAKQKQSKSKAKQSKSKLLYTLIDHMFTYYLDWIYNVFLLSFCFENVERSAEIVK